MRYGIYDLTKVPEGEEVVRCNYCWNYFYDEITDERNLNSLEFIKDGDEFFKGCPVCKTDDYLIDVDFQQWKLKDF